MNDSDILSRSNIIILSSYGTFHNKIYHKFNIGNETFHKLFYLVDGEYPSHPRF